MSLTRTFQIILILWLAWSTALAGPKPLFADHAILDLTIEAPLTRLMTERPDQDYLAARLSTRSTVTSPRFG